MANEFICSDCKTDGTRCDCHLRRKYKYIPTRKELTEEKIRQNEHEIRLYKKEIKELISE